MTTPPIAKLPYPAFDSDRHDSEPLDAFTPIRRREAQMLDDVIADEGGRILGTRSATVDDGGTQRKHPLEMRGLTKVFFALIASALLHRFPSR